MWAFPTSIIPKKNGTVRFTSDFRYLNKCLICKPYPILKIADVLQKLEGVRYATSLDPYMGYFTVYLDHEYISNYIYTYIQYPLINIIFSRVRILRRFLK